MKISHAIVGGATLITLAFANISQPSTAVSPNSQSVKSVKPVRIARVVACSPLNGTWFYSGKGIPVSLRGDRVTVNMSAFRRPTATGRMLSPTQLRVTFPDDGTFVGTLDGQGQISWNNSTVWQATQFAGTWQHEGKWGPQIQQLGDNLRVDMSRYSRPTALGNVTSPGRASVQFTDDATHTATLTGPNCIQWSNGTTWTK